MLILYIILGICSLAWYIHWTIQICKIKDILERTEKTASQEPGPYRMEKLRRSD